MEEAAASPAPCQTPPLRRRQRLRRTTMRARSRSSSTAALRLRPVGHGSGSDPWRLGLLTSCRAWARRSSSTTTGVVQQGDTDAAVQRLGRCVTLRPPATGSCPGACRTPSPGTGPSTGHPPQTRRHRRRWTGCCRSWGACSQCETCQKVASLRRSRGRRVPRRNTVTGRGYGWASLRAAPRAAPVATLTATDTFPPHPPGALLFPSARPYRTPKTRSRATCRASASGRWTPGGPAPGSRSLW